MGKAVKTFLMVFATLFVVVFLVSLGSVLSKFDPSNGKVDTDSILVLSLDGIILDGRIFLDNLKKYSKKENIKGVLIRINSPGGAVGPSQELYAEIKRVRDELQKPVVVSCTSIMASGGYYAAVAADQIVTNPGSLLGSIGVIMEFANLEELYGWMKVKRYVLKTGQFKDSGSDHRKMTDEERRLFQSMLDEVHEQFKQAVMSNRKLSKDIVDKYADGRVFTGETAVKLGFADQLGTFEDALRIVGDLSGLGSEPEIFKPPKKRPDLFELLAEVGSSVKMENAIEKILKIKTLGQPMYLMPGILGN